jgi:hypothetical protein
MTAKELFAVIVRSIGLVFAVGGFLALGARLIYRLLSPYPEPNAATLAVEYAFVTVVGICLFAATNWIVRAVYGK